jgi:hypothetical protein
MGTVESADDALQIFQIVDFVWSWARYVYRPRIRRCLDSLRSGTRYISRSSTEPPSHSHSVFSDANLESFNKLLLTDDDDDNIGKKVQGRNGVNHWGSACRALLRWEAVFQRSTTKHFDLCVRHSNVVSFAFKVLEIPRALIWYERFTDSLSDLGLAQPISALIKDSSYTVALTRARIGEMENFWIGDKGRKSYRNGKADSKTILRAFIFYRTFCGHTDRRITRELYCLLWSSEVLKNAGVSPPGHFDEACLEDFSKDDMKRALKQLRTIDGGNSVELAVNDTVRNLSLSKTGRAKWRSRSISMTLNEQMDKCLQLFDPLSDIYANLSSFRYENESLAAVESTGLSLPATFKCDWDDFEDSGVCLVETSIDSPEVCPKFCLFVDYNSTIDKDLLKTFRRDLRKLEKAKPGLRDVLPHLV